MKRRYIGIWSMVVLMVLSVGCQDRSLPVTVVETVSYDLAKDVDQDEMWGMLVIGDMRVCSLRDASIIDQTDLFCCPELNVFTALDTCLSGRTFRDMTLRELLAEREYGSVVVCLGLNEAGYPLDSLMRGFGELAGFLVRTQPQATIVFHAVITVDRNQAEQVPYTAPENLDLINAQMQKMAHHYRVNYLEMDPWFADDTGHLRAEAAGAGCRLSQEGCRRWAKWLTEQIPRMEDGYGNEDIGSRYRAFDAAGSGSLGT